MKYLKPILIFLTFIFALGLSQVIVAYAATVTYDDVPGSSIIIPDGGCGSNEILRTIDVPNSILITDVNFGFNTTHSFRGDVSLTLQSPTGTTVQLLAGSLDINANWDIMLDDESPNANNDGDADDTASPYYERTGQPLNPLSAFDGENAQGAWTVTICDDDLTTEGSYNRSQLVLVGEIQADFFVYLPLVLKGPEPAVWTPQSSGTSVTLNDISCVDAGRCVAVGDSGTILTTTDGGNSWNSQPSGTGNKLRGVSCRDANNCVVAGDSGLILTTGNGGSSWTSRNSKTGFSLTGVSCSGNTCFAVGGNFIGPDDSTLTYSFDGGLSWSVLNNLGNSNLFSVSCPADDTCTLVGKFGRIWTFQGQGIKTKFTFDQGSLYDVDCPSTSVCFTVGHAGQMRKTSNGGLSWNSLTSPTSIALLTVSCPTPSSCSAINSSSVVYNSTDGGSSWDNESSNAGTTLNSLSCPALGSCYAVGNNGTIVAKK